jgi:hypothetical protein
MVEDIDLLLPILFIKFISILHREVFLSKLNFYMYTHFSCRRDKLQSPVRAPRKASKASIEVSGQGSDNVSDTSPRSVDSI